MPRHRVAFGSSFTAILVVYSLPLFSVAQGRIEPFGSKAAVLDQSFLPYATVGVSARSIDYNGQSFTVGVAGTLVGVGLALSKDPGAKADMDFHIVRLINGMASLPSEVKLTVPNSMLPIDTIGVRQLSVRDLVQIDLEQYRIKVNPGDVFAMFIHSEIGFNERPGIDWIGGSDGYERGKRLQAWGLNDTILSGGVEDLAFQTWIIPVPEPASTVFFGSGLIALTLLFRRNRHHW